MKRALLLMPEIVNGSEENASLLRSIVDAYKSIGISRCMLECLRPKCSMSKRERDAEGQEELTQITADVLVALEISSKPSP